ncbi:MAG: peptidyl-prolyl cis-trans isomerase [Desulfobacteraceae bacterium]|nr:MAG: peptidyl-prolyl cis-trans isomerase [Desulfobacteraceae bacterium]
MKNLFKIIGCLFLIAGVSTVVFAVEKPAEPTKVRLETSHGIIVIALDPQKAPKTVDNFLAYVRDGFYNGTIFHRVIQGFMIQGGGFTENMQQKTAKAAIENEADNGLKNLRGTVAMARTSDPHSASAQFFINTVDNGFLDFTAKNIRGWGYCVFGRVVEGMDVVDAIAKEPTTIRNGAGDVPVKAVVINKAVIVAPEKATPAGKPGK